jgi:hypothetical protein
LQIGHDLDFYSSLTVMPTFYTVDRLGTLRAGLTVDSSQDYANCQFHTTLGGPTRTDLEVHLAGLFPDGLSNHGKFYLLNHSLINPTRTPGVPSGSMVPVSPMIELIVELVRGNDFPSRPSRYASMFALETADEALAFRSAMRWAGRTRWQEHTTFASRTARAALGRRSYESKRLTYD